MSGLRVFSLLIAFGGSFILLQGGCQLTPEAIAGLAAMKLNYNADALASVTAQAAASRVGFTLLAVAFVVELATSRDARPRSWMTLAAWAAFAFVVLGAAGWTAMVLRDSYVASACEVIEEMSSTPATQCVEAVKRLKGAK